MSGVLHHLALAGHGTGCSRYQFHARRVGQWRKYDAVTKRREGPPPSVELQDYLLEPPFS
jgi:hypothetical protein